MLPVVVFESLISIVDPRCKYGAGKIMLFNRYYMLWFVYAYYYLGLLIP